MLFLKLPILRVLYLFGEIAVLTEAQKVVSTPNIRNEAKLH